MHNASTLIKVDATKPYWKTISSFEFPNSNFDQLFLERLNGYLAILVSYSISKKCENLDIVLF